MLLNILRNWRGNESARSGNVIKEKEREENAVTMLLPNNLVVVVVLRHLLQMLLIIVVHIHIVDRTLIPIPILIPILNTTITITMLSILILMVVIVILVRPHCPHHQPQIMLVDLAQVPLQIKEDRQYRNHYQIKDFHHSLHNDNCRVSFLLALFRSMHIPSREWVRLLLLDFPLDRVVLSVLEVVVWEV